MRGWRAVTVATLVVALAAGCAGDHPAVPSSSAPSAPASITAAPASPATLIHGSERLGAPVPSRPVQPDIAAGYITGLVSDYCVDRDLPAPASTRVELTILDRSHALPAAYAPADLASASAAGFTGGSGSRLVSAAMVDDLAALRADSIAAGLAIGITSAYRSYASQVSTFNSWVARLGLTTALQRSARPGHSEHQLGTTLDLTSPGWNGRFGNWATETAEGRWLADNAWRYGFVMSYPLGSQDVTCFSYEPWHYRWIGREPAAAWHASGLYLRPFLERYVGG